MSLLRMITVVLGVGACFSLTVLFGLASTYIPDQVTLLRVLALVAFILSLIGAYVRVSPLKALMISLMASVILVVPVVLVLRHFLFAEKTVEFAWLAGLTVVAYMFTTFYLPLTLMKTRKARAPVNFVLTTIGLGMSIVGLALLYTQVLEHMVLSWIIVIAFFLTVAGLLLTPFLAYHIAKEITSPFKSLLRPRRLMLIGFPLLVLGLLAILSAVALIFALVFVVWEWLQTPQLNLLIGSIALILIGDTMALASMRGTGEATGTL